MRGDRQEPQLLADIVVTLAAGGSRTTVQAAPARAAKDIDRHNGSKAQ
jgi:hypothetical protein